MLTTYSYELSSTRSAVIATEENVGFVWIGLIHDIYNYYIHKYTKDYSFVVKDAYNISDLMLSAMVENSGFVWIGLQRGITEFKFNLQNHRYELVKLWRKMELKLKKF